MCFFFCFFLRGGESSFFLVVFLFFSLPGRHRTKINKMAAYHAWEGWVAARFSKSRSSIILTVRRGDLGCHVCLGQKRRRSLLGNWRKKKNHVLHWQRCGVVALRLTNQSRPFPENFGTNRKIRSVVLIRLC